MDEELEQTIASMKKEIDALQSGMAERSKPWYLNTSSILSIVALLFSFGTTYVSHRRAEAQDTQNSR